MRLLSSSGNIPGSCDRLLYVMTMKSLSQPLDGLKFFFFLVRECHRLSRFVTVCNVLSSYKCQKICYMLKILSQTEKIEKLQTENSRPRFLALARSLASNKVLLTCSRLLSAPADCSTLPCLVSGCSQRQRTDRADDPKSEDLTCSLMSLSLSLFSLSSLSLSPTHSLTHTHTHTHWHTHTHTQTLSL